MFLFLPPCFPLSLPPSFSFPSSFFFPLFSLPPPKLTASITEEAMECERWGTEEEVAMDVDVSETEQLQLISQIQSTRDSILPTSSLESFGIPQDASPATFCVSQPKQHTRSPLFCSGSIDRGCVNMFPRQHKMVVLACLGNGPPVGRGRAYLLLCGFLLGSSCLN